MDSVWNAHQNWWPSVFTYLGPDMALRRENRRYAMLFEYDGISFEIPRIESRDRGETEKVRGHR